MLEQKNIEEEIREYDPTLFQDTLGSFVKSLLTDYKLILIRERWFYHQHRPEIRHETKKAINDSLRQLEGALRTLLSIFDKFPEHKKRILKEVEELKLLEILILKEQLCAMSDETLGEVTEVIDQYLKKKEELG